MHTGLSTTPAQAQHRRVVTAPSALACHAPIPAPSVYRIGCPPSAAQCPCKGPICPPRRPACAPVHRSGVDFSSVAVLSRRDFRLPARQEYHQGIIQISPRKCTLSTPGVWKLCSRSRAEVVDVAPARSPAKPCSATCVHAGVSRKVSVPSFSFLRFSPHFTICNEPMLEKCISRRLLHNFFYLFPLYVQFWRSFGLARCSSRVSE